MSALELHREGAAWIRQQNLAGGSVLFDARLFPAAPGELFDVSNLQQAGRVIGKPDAGRGSALFISTGLGDAVLRHYRRGGLVAGLLGDRYLWLGGERTRSFREFRLLAHLYDAGLPVPRPLAARYLRHGPSYRADLLTLAVPQAQTLAQRLAADAVDEALISEVARAIARFHRAGVFHADLNAHNILLDAGERVLLLDFDRGQLRNAAPAWQLANVSRLQRSLRKLAESAEQAEYLGDMLLRHWRTAMEERAVGGKAGVG